MAQTAVFWLSPALLRGTRIVANSIERFGADGLMRLPSEVSAMHIQNDGNIVVTGATLEPVWSSPRDFVLFPAAQQ
jgi:hypothetical protein